MNIVNNTNTKNKRNIVTAGIAALTGIAAVVGMASAPAVAQFGGPRDGFYQRQRPVVIPWSYADARPNLPAGQATGLFIWHDRNTTHIQSTDNHWFGDDINGFIEIKGGTFDNVKNESNRDDSRYHRIGNNRIAFHFSAKDNDVESFKFNVHKGDRIVVHIGLDGHRTGRIYYGQQMSPAGEDPVAFDMHK